jgi:hypothetical protein
MARKTTATPSVASTPSTPSVATPSVAKFRQIDATQLLTHIRKMDGIHTAKSTPRKFEHFVNLNVNEIADILGRAEIDNVNSAINVFVNAKTIDAVNAAITAGTIDALTIRKK